MDKVLGFINMKVFGSVDKLVAKWLRFRNQVPIQQRHSNEPGFYKWHHANYRWYTKVEYDRAKAAR